MLILVAIFLIIFLSFSLTASKDVLHRVDTDKKVLYLTFDDGPGPYTKQVLNFLEDKQVPATFFIVGDRVKDNSDLIRRMADDGHAIGTHSNTHPLLFRNIKEELLLSKLSIEYAGGRPVTLFRAPWGIVFPWTLKPASDLDLKIVAWSCFPRDYSATTQQIVSRVSKCFNPGEIIVLHPWNHPQTIQALPEIVSLARSQGYKFAVLENDVNNQ